MLGDGGERHAPVSDQISHWEEDGEAGENGRNVLVTENVGAEGDKVTILVAQLTVMVEEAVKAALRGLKGVKGRQKEGMKEATAANGGKEKSRGWARPA